MFQDLLACVCWSEQDTHRGSRSRSRLASANSAVFSVADAVLFKTLPVKTPPI
jgi:hypothetical protein